MIIGLSEIPESGDSFIRRNGGMKTGRAKRKKLGEKLPLEPIFPP
jgi:hypothetical protein